MTILVSNEQYSAIIEVIDHAKGHALNDSEDYADAILGILELQRADLAAQGVKIPDIARRRELADYEVTLNGQRAKVVGVLNDFATVATLPDGPKADFAWVTVENIVTNHNGEFNA